ncbi:hypothetical protein [Mycobacterium marseillense]|uniref:hypothetical protein n=1 Tax=Mycobacterium marseillense TaxID=701042 RepID=UPI0011A0C515|nr:hypothetical protein [Mycobacterium marseillense]
MKLVMWVGPVLLGLLAAPVVARADTNSYMNCIDMSMQHLGNGTPASSGSWIQLGKSIRESVQQAGVSPTQEIGVVEQLGWNHQTAEAIVQCALVNGPL